MNFIKCFAALGLILAVVACGGGGGSPGATTNSAPSAPGAAGTNTPVSKPTMELTFVDASGVVVSNHSLSQTQAQFLKVTLKDSTGALAPYVRVTIALDSTTAVLVPSSGTQLTDSSGVVLMRIAPTGVTSSGTVLATATATVDAIEVSQTYSLQISPGTVTLSAISLSPTNVQKGQAVNVSVDVAVNGSPAPSNSVSVDFTSLCGTATPASALVDSTGRASAVIQTSNAGNCAVSAIAGGVTQSASYTVTSAPVTGIQFVSAAPSLLYQVGSAGATTSVVTFKVIDSVANGVQGVSVNASLTNTDGGINFCGSPSTGTSAADGTVTFSICSGTFPATVQVRAELANNISVFTNSNLLTIQTGLATQRFFDISANQLNFYAGGYFTSKFNGNSATISVFAADRQGNPVPNGTKIVFVSEGGQINSSNVSSCLVASGRCSVILIGQDYRPMGSSAPNGDQRPGRVTVLAYADGEESYVDANNDNRYNPGELFEDIGSLYLDKDESGAHLSSYTNLVTGTNEGEVIYPMPSGSTGTNVCPANSNVGLSVAGTCNGVWDAFTKVRREIVIVFSGGEIGQPGNWNAVTNPSGYVVTIPTVHRTETIQATNSAITVRLADRNGNPLPADATVGITVIKPEGNECTAALVGNQIGSSTEPTLHTALLNKCGGGEVVRFDVKVTAGVSTISSSYSVIVPVAPTDTTPPVVTGGPMIEAITTTTALFSATLNESGTGYYHVLPANAPAPTAFAVTNLGTSFSMPANVQAGKNLTGLTTNTNYRVYFVAKDSAGNLSALSSYPFSTL